MQAVQTPDAMNGQHPAPCYPLTGQPAGSAITIMCPTPEALRKIADNLSDADRDELAAAGHHDALKAMGDAIATCREAYVACWDGEPQAVFGINDLPLDPRHGIPWLLSTGTASKHARDFMATARRMVAAWSPMYLSMRNVASEEHTAARGWLKALGFSEEATHTLGSRRFVEYVRHV